MIHNESVHFREKAKPMWNPSPWRIFCSCSAQRLLFSNCSLNMQHKPSLCLCREASCLCASVQQTIVPSIFLHVAPLRLTIEKNHFDSGSQWFESFDEIVCLGNYNLCSTVSYCENVFLIKPRTHALRTINRIKKTLVTVSFFYLFRMRPLLSADASEPAPGTCPVGPRRTPS
jgi:hypothetical protein